MIRVRLNLRLPLVDSCDVLTGETEGSLIPGANADEETVANANSPVRTVWGDKVCLTNGRRL